MEDLKLTQEEEMQKLKAEITKNEHICVTYLYLKQGKWKIKTETIESDKLPEYEEKYRVQYITTLKTHNDLIAKLKRRK